ncbi:phage holin family protein [Saxibacter everestensis]|uniref:Phage holin family protein n=1 Tax=Saxibacter everestensis TaxID=2909229 RepID=A0ABY8QUV0_9MICO|nr:phage holin family protein [Brevibacteriaceae bacterium ZFBP1038]
MRFILQVLISALALWVADLLIDGFSISGSILSTANADGTMNSILTYLIVGLIFGLVNAIVKPIVKLIALPAYILTLGLFTFIVNALMLKLVEWISGITPITVTIDKFFWDAILAALIVSIVSFFGSLLTGGREKAENKR